MRSSVRLALFAIGMTVALLGHAEVQVNRPAPKVDTELLNGKVLSVRDLAGKVVLTVFWATWCPTCVKEMPELQRLYDAYRSRGLEIVALSLDVDAEEAGDFWKEKGYTFPVAMRTGAVKQAWGPVPATPQIVLTDRSGVVRFKHLGGMGYERLEVQVKPLL